MTILDIAIIIFIVMETANVVILYFAPDSKFGNGVAIFNQWNKSKEDENSHLFSRYMAFWVAGTKLIFIVLLLVILLAGNQPIKLYAVLAMILSIATYFWKLHPIIKKLDMRGEITPKGYSRTLSYMIMGFLMMFSAALIIYLVI
jgi:hypothetical protein